MYVHIFADDIKRELESLGAFRDVPQLKATYRVAQ